MHLSLSTDMFEERAKLEMMNISIGLSFLTTYLSIILCTLENSWLLKRLFCLLLFQNLSWPIFAHFVDQVHGIPVSCRLLGVIISCVRISKEASKQFSLLKLSFEPY